MQRGGLIPLNGGMSLVVHLCRFRPLCGVASLSPALPLLLFEFADVVIGP